MNEREILIKALNDILHLPINSIALVANYAVPNVLPILQKMEDKRVVIWVNQLQVPINFFPNTAKNIDSDGKLIVYYIVRNSIKTEMELVTILGVSQSTISGYVNEVSQQYSEPLITLSLQ